MTSRSNQEPKPNLLIIGAARSGTTALAESLNRHPDVRLSQPKECHFLTHAGQAPAYNGPGDDVMMSRLIHDPADYAALFAGSTERYRVDGSVSTLYWPSRALPNISRYCEADTKLVCVLRRPSLRAHSAYLYLRSRGHEKAPTLADGLRQEHEREARGFHHMWHYESMSRYDEQLPAFAEAFGDRLHLMIFEEYRLDPVHELERLCGFLGLEMHPSMAIRSEINRGGEVRSAAVQRFLHAARSQPTVRRAVTRSVPRVLRDKVKAKNLQRPALDPETLATLEDRLQPAVDAAEEVLGRPIEAWTGPPAA